MAAVPALFGVMVGGLGVPLALSEDRQVRLELHLPEPVTKGGYDLAIRAEVERLVVDTDKYIRRYEEQRRQREELQARWVTEKDLREMSGEELKAYYHPPADYLMKREERGLKHLRRLGRELLRNPNQEDRRRLQTALMEVAHAINNSRRSPAPQSVDGIQIPFVLIDHAHNPVAKGKRMAANLVSGWETDLSRRDPQESTFWQRPGAIKELDLKSGFGRSSVPDIEHEMWEYAGPKTSYGGNPGFEVRRGDRVVKVKFGETRSEPFTARVFWALGYHVDPTDHVPGVRVRYDRRVFREFHMRRELETKFRLFWFLRVHTMKLQKRYDPFDYIVRAVMKDGRELTSQQLRQALFREPAGRYPEEEPTNFRSEIEEAIEYLVTVEANVQEEDETVKSIGPWDFGQLDHADRREVRGVGLLAAWLGWYDSRFDNTRLKLAETEQGRELRHYFSDLGGTLGRGKGFFSGRGELPNEFEWTFTRSRFSGASPERSRGFRITGFKPIQDTAAFKEMTVEDARWMARLIGQLTERQIREGLEASGFSAAAVTLYVQKLIWRRDQMIKDLGLESEIPLLHMAR